MLSKASFSYFRETKDPSAHFVIEVVFSKLSSSEGGPKLKRKLPKKRNFVLGYKHLLNFKTYCRKLVEGF